MYASIHVGDVRGKSVVRRGMIFFNAVTRLIRPLKTENCTAVLTKVSCGLPQPI